MSSRVDFTKENLAWSSLWGIGRGIIGFFVNVPVPVPEFLKITFQKIASREENY